MVANLPLILGIFASFLAVGNLLYIYLRTKVKGPKFVLVNTRITTYRKLKKEMHDEYKDHFECTFNVKIMNIGDRTGILFLNSNKLIIDNCKEPFEYPVKEWDAPIIADGTSGNTYTYYIPPKYQAWSEGKLILKGYFYNHDGLYNNFEATFRGKNKEYDIWKLQMNYWKRKWMQIRHRSRLKQIVE